MSNLNGEQRLGCGGVGRCKTRHERPELADVARAGPCEAVEKSAAAAVVDALRDGEEDAGGGGVGVEELEAVGSGGGAGGWAEEGGEGEEGSEGEGEGGFEGGEEGGEEVGGGVGEGVEEEALDRGEVQPDDVEEGEGDGGRSDGSLRRRYAARLDESY